MEDDGAAAAAGEQPQPVVRAILYGNTATELTDEERTDQASHRWTVYLRPAAHPDVSYIKRVTFQLHKSFRSPRRVVEEPPFEVTETGWGEFEINITINFVDPAEKSTSVIHCLKLFPNETTIAKDKNTIISEQYDEIVFPHPTPAMQQALHASSGPANSTVSTARNYGDEEKKQVEIMKSAKAKLQGLLGEAKKKYERVEEELKALQAEANVGAPAPAPAPAGDGAAPMATE